MCLSDMLAMPQAGNQAVSPEMPAIHEPLFSDRYSQPTREGALEYSPVFRDAAAKAWAKVGYGNKPRPEQGNPEAGFTVGRNGNIGAPLFHSQEFGHGEMQIPYDDNTLAVFHTHSDPWTRRPSSGDEASAKSQKMQIYTATKDGLFLTGPDGKTIQVFNRDDWATKKNR